MECLECLIFVAHKDACVIVFLISPSYFGVVGSNKYKS